jgi:hypothetical protein
MLSWLNRAFWRYCELVGQCQDYGAEDVLSDGDLRDGQAPDPGEAYIANGIEELERFVELRSRRPWR